MTKLTNLLVEALKTKECTLKELYLIIEDHPEFEWTPSVRKHRIRSALFNLKEQKIIKRTDPCTYKIV